MPARIPPTRHARRPRVAGDRQHVDAERREAGDGQAEHHVVVDLEHVGAQALVDGRGLGARRLQGRTRMAALRSKSDIVEPPCLLDQSDSGLAPISFPQSGLIDLSRDGIQAGLR